MKELQNKLDEVQKNHSAFLLYNYDILSAMRIADEKLQSLPQRLKKGSILHISSGEMLPGAYRATCVNNTIVELRHNGKDWKLSFVKRISVRKNTGVGNYLRFRQEVEAEIKQRLFNEYCVI